VRFTGRVPDDELARLYRTSRAVIHPQHEDFGLVAVEAQAAGRPVIGFGRGGLVDTVVPLSPEAAAGPSSTPVDATGVFFDEPTVDSLNQAIERFEKVEPRFDPAALRRWADRFSPARFDAAFDAEVALALGQVGQASAARPAAHIEGPSS
jgi:glycosyltransferase involved in cell wall biosynthesis